MSLPIEISKKDVLSLVQDLKHEENAVPVQEYISLMEKLSIKIYSLRPNSDAPYEKHRYQIEILRNDNGEKIEFLHNPKFPESPFEIPSLKDILSDIGEYGKYYSIDKFEGYRKQVQKLRSIYNIDINDFKEAVVISKKFKSIFNEAELNVISKICPPHIWVHIEKQEMDRLYDLDDQAAYYENLLSESDINLDNVERKMNRVGKDEKQIQVIQSYFDNYKRSLKAYDEYEDQLGSKYRVDGHVVELYHIPDKDFHSMFKPLSQMDMDVLSHTA